jgi:hypothetical protein
LELGRLLAPTHPLPRRSRRPLSPEVRSLLLCDHAPGGKGGMAQRRDRPLPFEGRPRVPLSVDVVATQRCHLQSSIHFKSCCPVGQQDMSHLTSTSPARSRSTISKTRDDVQEHLQPDPQHAATSATSGVTPASPGRAPESAASQKVRPIRPTGQRANGPTGDLRCEIFGAQHSLWTARANKQPQMGAFHLVPVAYRPTLRRPTSVAREEM